MTDEQWQPIETAPKDGMKIDLWLEWPDGERYRAADAYWSTEAEEAPPGGAWRIGQYHVTQFTTPPRVTHWMPIPAGPASPNQKGA